MNTVDRILVALLIVLLPIGLFVSYKIMGPDNDVGEVTIDAEKLKVMVENYSNMQVNNKPDKEIVVSSVSYASESGIITVSGDAPSSGASILMSVTVLPPKPSPTPVASESVNNKLVLGRSVDTLSFDTGKNGSFTIDYGVEGSSASEIELRLEQDDAVKTIRFDLVKREQIY